jgi:hypothetical protein
MSLLLGIVVGPSKHKAPFFLKGRIDDSFLEICKSRKTLVIHYLLLYKIIELSKKSSKIEYTYPLFCINFATGIR